MKRKANKKPYFALHQVESSAPHCMHALATMGNRLQHNLPAYINIKRPQHNLFTVQELGVVFVAAKTK